MHTRPEDIVANDNNYNLFVRLPTSRTITIRNLTKQVTVAEIRDRLEILAGLPCQLYEISLAGGQHVLAESAKLVFGRDLRNGSILKTSLHSHFEVLFNTIKDNEADADILYSLIVGNEKALSSRGSVSSDGEAGDNGRSSLLEDYSNAERCSIMLYLASHFGHHVICKLLLRLDPEGPKRTTCFGRTALHAAAANDQLKILQVLLQAGAELSPQDAFGKTPLEYSRENHACTCERVLKYKVLSMAKGAEEQETEQMDEQVGTARLKSGISRGGKEEKAKLRIRVKSAKGEKCSKVERQEGIELTARGTAGGAPATRPTPTSTAAGNSTKKVYWGSSGSVSCKKSATIKASAGTQQKYKATEPASTSDQSHAGCYKVPNFVAVRRVPLEEQRLVTMEFTPMDRPTTQQCRPKSSLPIKAGDKHAWAEKVVRSKVEVHGSKETVNGRTQSAQYYKTKYHPQDEVTEYRERPATAGPRFRFWKTWLLEKLEQEAIKGKMDKQDHDRRQRNMAAYKRWLARKEREETRQQREEESSESSDEEENLGYGNWPSEKEMAFKNWLESKRSMIVSMARRKQQEQERSLREAAAGPHHKDIYDRRSTIFEIGCTDPTPIRQPAPERYICAYKSWLARREKYEAWKAKNNVQLDLDDGQTTDGDIEAAKYTFFMEGMTYGEWLGMKEKEAKLSKDK